MKYFLLFISIFSFITPMNLEKTHMEIKLLIEKINSKKNELKNVTKEYKKKPPIKAIYLR